MYGKLFIVPTPIGNIHDMTFRSVDVLKNVDLVLCEDTRITSKILNHYQITVPLKAYHQVNEQKLTPKIIEELEKGKAIALCSDAGTPGISDPAFFLVRAAIESQINIETLPGATAFVPALINSGLPTDSFIFEGFLPRQKGRQKKLKFLSQETRTIILYESPHRIVKLLQELCIHCGKERQISVSRELSKKFEETLRGSAEDLLNHFEKHEPKGEFVIIVNGN